ncbi:MAG: hypothetical protein QME75_00380 [Deltaproteobacteria bacterium]|nr:hypothetical protein [Deltaproteobacteria bacterium]
MRKTGLAVLLCALMVGCAGQAHISVPPKAVWLSGGGDASRQPTEPDPTRPPNLPDRTY